MKNYILKNLNDVYFKLLFIIISVFFLSKLVISYQQILGDSWAYNNLFINYSAGFVRRGLLGEIFININEILNIGPLYFFTTVFFIAYFLQIFFFYKILEKYKDYKILVTIIVLSPVLIYLIFQFSFLLILLSSFFNNPPLYPKQIMNLLNVLPLHLL